MLTMNVPSIAGASIQSLSRGRTWSPPAAASLRRIVIIPRSVCTPHRKLTRLELVRRRGVVQQAELARVAVELVREPVGRKTEGEGEIPRPADATGRREPGNRPAWRARARGGALGHRLGAKFGYESSCEWYRSSGRSKGPIAKTSLKSGGVSPPCMRASVSSP